MACSFILVIAGEGSAIQNTLTDLTGLRTVPNVFVNGKSIGKCMELTEPVLSVICSHLSL